MANAGDVLDGRYRLIELLGEGGMGEVWTAENVSIRGAEVAVKVLHANFAKDPDAVRRFHAEAEATVRISHPNIVRVHDFGQSTEGAPFMVMERLRGESLAGRLEREGTIPSQEAVDITCTVLEALAAAHEREILHRDLKPENIFLAVEGEALRPKILDFGVAKFLGDDAERVRMTRTGALIGTPAYMSPEQALGETAIDLRSDVWAMGVILYELLTGRLPYEASNYNAMLIRIGTGSHTPLREALPDIDPVLASIVERAMARAARDRYASARAMLDALRAYARGEGVLEATSLPTVRPDPGMRPKLPTLEGGDTLLDHSVKIAAKPPRRAGAIAVAATVVIGAVVAVVALTHNPHPPAPVVTAERDPRLTLHGLPAGATVFLDDTAVTLPAPMRRDADHRVRVEAPGVGAWMAVVPRPSADVTLAYFAPAPAAADAGSVTSIADAAIAPRDPPNAPRRMVRRTDAGRGGNAGLLSRDPGF